MAKHSPELVTMLRCCDTCEKGGLLGVSWQGQQEGCWRCLAIWGSILSEHCYRSLRGLPVGFSCEIATLDAADLSSTYYDGSFQHP